VNTDSAWQEDLLLFSQSSTTACGARLRKRERPGSHWQLQRSISPEGQALFLLYRFAFSPVLFCRFPLVSACRLLRNPQEMSI
jgi:hypothetical protein